MAQLPGGRYLMQQIGGDVVMFERYTEDEIVRFDPASSGSVEQGLAVLRVSGGLLAEEECFAAFWAGYFAAHAGCPAPDPVASRVEYDEASSLVGVFPPGNNHRVIVQFDPRDADATAKAQLPVHATDQLDERGKQAAHFASGYYYGLASR
jgi:hypothetical protein